MRSASLEHSVGLGGEIVREPQGSPVTCHSLRTFFRVLESLCLGSHYTLNCVPYSFCGSHVSLSCRRERREVGRFKRPGYQPRLRILYRRRAVAVVMKALRPFDRVTGLLKLPRATANHPLD